MEKKDNQIKFRLTEEMKTDIEILAERKNVSASWIIREAVKDFIKKEAEKAGLKNEQEEKQ